MFQYFIRKFVNFLQAQGLSLLAGKADEGELGKQHRHQVSDFQHIFLPVFIFINNQSSQIFSIFFSQFLYFSIINHLHYRFFGAHDRAWIPLKDVYLYRFVLLLMFLTCIGLYCPCFHCFDCSYFPCFDCRSLHGLGYDCST